MKDLCIDVRMALSSGIGTYIRNLLLGLKDGPFKLKVIAHPKILEKWPLLSQFDLIFTDAKVYSIEEQIKLPLIIPSCDLFWSPHFNVPLMPIRAKRRVATIHDVYYLAYGHTLSIQKKIYANTFISQAAKRSDLLITISQFSSDELMKYVKAPRERIEIISLGVDSLHFHPRPNESNVLAKYNLPEKYLLFVGNLAPHKNIQGLIKSLQYLRDKSLKLVLVGAKMKETFIADDRIIFLGPVEDQDLPFIYQGAYITVHPSFYEGFGLTPLEAMSSGCPVVVSKAASLPEVCGDAAVYIDPSCPKSIAEGIEEMTPLRDLFKIKGLERSRTFGWDRCVKRHVEVMEKLVGLS